MAKKLDLFIEIFGKENVTKLFDKIGNSADKVGQGFGGLTGNVSAGVIQAEIFGRVADAAFSAVGASVDALGASLGSARDKQDSLLAATASFAAVGDVSFDVAGESLARINKQLDVSAAALPGVTSEYTSLANSLVDNFLPAAKLADGSVDFAKFEKEILSVTESFGALGATAGIATADISKGLGKALQGKSLSELGDLQLFEENPAVLGQIEKQLAARNVKTLKDLDLSARIGLIESVGREFITEEYKAAAEASVSGLVESFRSTLIGDNGVFSLVRDTDLDKEGIQSVFSSLNASLAAIIGSDGILSPSGPLAGILEALGVDLPDPMKYLYRQSQRMLTGIETFSTFLEGVAENIENGIGSAGIVKDLFAGGLGPAAIGDNVASLFSAIAEKVADVTLSMVEQFPAEDLGEDLGAMLGAGVVTLIREFPWGTVAKSLLVAAAQAEQFMYSTFKGLLEEITRKIANWVGDGAARAIAAISPFSESDVKRSQGIAGQTTSQAASITAPLLSSIPVFGPLVAGIAKPTRSRTVGQSSGLPSAIAPAEAYDILSAAAREKNAQPGTNIVVANSSERIIPRGLNAATPGAGLRGAAGGVSRGGVTTINLSPTIIMGDKSTRQQAEELLAMVSEMLGREQEAQLAF